MIEALWPWLLAGVFAAFMMAAVHQRDRAHRALFEAQKTLRRFNLGDTSVQGAKTSRDVLPMIDKELAGSPFVQPYQE